MKVIGMNNMIYSDSLGGMTIKGFYMKKVNGEYRHYTWNEEDCVYWADDVDDRYYFEIPKKRNLYIKIIHTLSYRHNGEKVGTI